MFQIGDFVVSAGGGVCRIEDVVQMEMPGITAKKDCYLVIPIGENAAKKYIPVENKKKQIRPVMTREEAEQLMSGFMEIEETWIESDKLREKTYKEAIFSSDPRRLVSILKTMYQRGQERQAEGKKTTTIDERYLRIAEKNLHDELAFVLDITTEDVRDTIIKKVKAGKK